MNLKYFKNIFTSTIIILIIAGIYIIYIKDDNSHDNVQSKSKEIKTTKEIVMGITEFDTINPILTKSLEIQFITKLVYEPLVNITKDFNLEPALAEEWSKLDNLTYIIKLDENKKWQDGEPVTVEDVEFTINKIKETESIYKENTENIERIEKLNENTLKIYLSKEVAFFEYLLCFPIMQEKTYNADIPMGTGKYKIQSINADEIIVQGQETKLIVKTYKSISELYNQFTRENVDLIITQNTNYEEYIGSIGFEESIITGREFYYISCENIKDEEIRKYINNSINKEKIVYDLYNKRYIIADFPLQYGSYLNLKENNVKDELKLNINKKITLSTNKENVEIAKIIKEQLAEKNITINILEYVNSNADLILRKETVSITPDINKYFKDKEIKEKISRIEEIENREILQQEYNKVIEEYYEEVPFISLYFNSYIILRTNKLKGDFSGNWYNMFYNIDTWYKIVT